jgi:hypothetical protein
MIYNINTIHSLSGSQVPPSSLKISIPKNDEAAFVCK